MRSAQGNIWECASLWPIIVSSLDLFLRIRREKVSWKTLAKLQVWTREHVCVWVVYIVTEPDVCVCVSEGLQEVILYTQPDDKKKNRGFCFLEYEDHKSAAQARRRLMSGKVKVWGNPVTVEWADPVAEPDPEVMAKVSHRVSTHQTHDDVQVFIVLCVSSGKGSVCA